MWHCDYMKRDCTFSGVCKKDWYTDLSHQNDIIEKYNEDEITIIQYMLGIREIMKFEWSQKEIQYADRNKIQSLLDTYLEEYSFGYSSIALQDNGYGFFLAGRDELSLRNFLHSNYSSDIQHKIIKVGLMMGYPKCCIKNYIKFINEHWYTSALDDKMCEAVIDNDSTCPLVGSRQKLFVHFPCSKKCEDTMKKSEKVLRWVIASQKINEDEFFQS